MTSPEPSRDEAAIGYILDRLAQHITGAWISDEMPAHDALESNLPAIVLEDMPGWTDGQPLGGAPLVHELAVDVAVYARDVSTARTIAAAVERIVFAAILDGDGPIMSVSQPVTMHKRPDWNDRVKRVGGEFSLRISTAR